MAIRAGLVVAMSLLFNQALAADLTQYDVAKSNEMGEEELSLTIQDKGREVLRLKIPSSQVDIERWQENGRLRLDWRQCRTEEMLAGGGELNQCFRRAFLSIGGEADSLSPGVLDLEVTADGQLQADYVPAAAAGDRALHLVAHTDKAGQSWQQQWHKIAKLAPAAPKNTVDFTGSATEFIFFGDAGSGDRNQFAVAQGIANFCQGSKQKCAFALMLGDNFYSNGVSSVNDKQWIAKFEKPYAPLNLQFRAALGNHDHYGNIQAELDYRSAHWYLPGRYYSFVEGNAAFFAIDSDDFDADQAAWLETKLRESTQQWKIVYGHHPIYSSGEHGDTSYLKNSLLPVLKRNHADFYLSGHDHHKEIIERDGMTFVVTGTGGAKLYRASKGRSTTFLSSSHGFSHFTFDQGSATLQILDQNGGLQHKRTFSKAARLAN